MLISACLSCHHIGVTNSTHAAPSLLNIFKRKAGSDQNFKYSNAFKNKNFQWNKDNLIEYLINPDGFLPGTTKQKIVSNRAQAIKIVNKIEEYTSK